MAWTPMKTWSVNAQLPANELNVYLRDNGNDLAVGIGARIANQNDGGSPQSMGVIMATISLPTAEWDNDVMTATANRITINRPGFYQVTGQAAFVPTTTLAGSAAGCFLELIVNGARIIGGASMYVPTSLGLLPMLNVHAGWVFAANDYVEMRASCDGTNAGKIGIQANSLAPSTWPFLSALRTGYFTAP